MKTTKVAITRQTPFVDLPEFLRPKEVRAFLGVSPDTIYRAIQNGELPHRRIGNNIFISKESLREAVVA